MSEKHVNKEHVKVDAHEVKKCINSNVKHNYENKMDAGNVTSANGDGKEKSTHKKDVYASGQKFKTY